MFFLIMLSVLTAGFTGKMPELSSSVLQGAGQAIELILTVGANVILWGGFMKIADKSGLTEALGKIFTPILHKTLFRGLKKGSHALHLIALNFAANLIGLGNAAMPIGLSAMQALENEQNCGDTASDEMITFVVMNTASLQIIPTTAIMLRTKYGSLAPTEIISSVGIASAASLAAGLAVAKILCKIKKSKTSKDFKKSKAYADKTTLASP